MNILVIGSGMYVTGRNNSGTGTILSSLVQASKTLPIESIHVISKSEQSQADVDLASKEIQSKLDTHIPVHFSAAGDDLKGCIEHLHQQHHFSGAVVSLPDHLHFSAGKHCLDLGIHLLMVKPLTPTLAEAQTLTDLAEKNQVFACVEFHKRFDETNLWIQKSLQAQSIGDINYFTVDYSQKISIPEVTFKGWAAQTNIFQYLGVHYVDLIYFLTGATPLRISALGSQGTLFKKGITPYDSVHCTIEWKHHDNTFISIHNTNWVDPNCTSAMSDQKYKVIGTEGRIECDQKNRGLELVSNASAIQQINPYFSEYLPDVDGSLTFQGYGFKSILQFMQDITDLATEKQTLQHLTATRPSFKNSLVSTAVIDAGNASLGNNGQWTDIVKP